MTIKFVNDGAVKLTQGNKEGFYQATVRFSNTTTFEQLKEFICNFWVRKINCLLIIIYYFFINKTYLINVSFRKTLFF